MFQKTFFSHHYFFCTYPFYISIICPEGTIYREVSGHLAVYCACYVHSVNFTTFPSKLHQAFMGNSSARIYSLFTLDNTYLSHIKYLSTQVPEFTFSDTSGLETAVHKVLPGYLHPYVHYPSIVIPIVIIIIILIPLCCWVKKALTLYTILRRKRRVTVRDQDANV